MTAVFINSFILFFVTIDTIGNLPFFLSLTEEAKVKQRNQIAKNMRIIPPAIFKESKDTSIASSKYLPA